MMLLRVLTLVALGLAASPSHGVEKELSFFDMALLSAYRYPGEGMEPSIHSGEFIYIDKIGFSASQIQPGNIVVFKQPGTSGTLTAKRAAALGGSTLQFRQWKLFVDDKEIPEPYVDPKNVMSDSTFEWGAADSSIELRVRACRQSRLGGRQQAAWVRPYKRNPRHSQIHRTCKRATEGKDGKLRSNLSIKRTSSSWLRQLAAAAHVGR